MNFAMKGDESAIQYLLEIDLRRHKASVRLPDKSILGPTTLKLRKLRLYFDIFNENEIVHFLDNPRRRLRADGRWFHLIW